MDNKKSFLTIDEYILQYDTQTQEKLTTLRRVIKETIPEAKEKISWQMPTFILYRNLIHFAAFKNHIGLYPGPEVIDALQEKLKGYKTSKGAIQLPLHMPLPLELIIDILKEGAARNIEWARGKDKI